MAMPEDEVSGAPTGRPPLRPFRALPGGATPIPDEWYAAGVLLGSLGILILIRRNLGPEGRTLVGGTAAVVGFLYFLIYTGVVRVAIDFLSDSGERDTPLTRGLAFFA